MEVNGKLPMYIVLMKATQKGLANPKKFLSDVKEARETIEKFGGKLLDWTLTMGQYDAVAKIEFPDDYTTAAFTLTIAKTGNQETTTMRAFSETELKQIAEKIP
jgi:uncharacterized protein with GYD domain